MYWRWLVAGACLWTTTLTAQMPEVDWNQAMGWASEVAAEWEPDPEALAMVMPDHEDWRVFWEAVQQALGSDSLLDMADLYAYAGLALDLLQRQPGGADLAAWLRPRMDYFQLADVIARPGRPEHRPHPPAGIRPPKPVAPLPAPPAAETARAWDFNVWRSRIAGRRPPSNAERYVPLLKPLFQAEGVPDALVWLAEVESSFRPEARSPVGALGLYQFMPATAERFGLALKPRDERLQPEASARAAAQYLRLLHRRFQSWPLALAAYNAGEGRVGRLLKRHNADSFEGIVQHLPAETRMYVPKVRAVVLARENTDLALW
ncbi:MAG: lytic transglycosylase domain-containing protein [Kiritimatiellia bacterium]